MKVIRMIHPVGQGGFYTETLCNGNSTIKTVYDCGGFDKYGKRKMESYLDCYLHKEKPLKSIEAVFISHFHADHINGLQYLLKNAEVKYLFLPQLNDNVMLEAFLYNYCLTGNYNHTNQLLMHLYKGDREYGTADRRTKIIQIRSSAEQYVQGNRNLPENTDNSLGIRAWDWEKQKDIDLMSQNIIASNVILYCGKWLYIPFNPPISSKKMKKLKTELSKALNKKIEIADLPTSLKAIGVKKCKKIYDDVFKKQHNGYSMTLFSGTMEQAACSEPQKFWCKFMGYSECRNPNFLYTGDFEPQSNICGIKEHYKICWDKIASIQIPHHGSKNNYVPEMYEYPVMGIVSVGNDNTYHHPDIDTLVNIQSKGCLPVIVTEDKSSMRIFQYKIL